MLGAADPNYTISYAAGSVTVDPAPLTITASSGSMTYGGTVPTITAATRASSTATPRPSLTGEADLLDHGDQLEPGPGSPYPSSCSGAVDPNYAISYVGGLGDGQHRRR